MNGVVRSAPLRGASDRSTRSRPPCSADATASVDVPSKQCVHSAATRRRAAPAPPARARQARRSRQLFAPRCAKRSLAAWSAHRSPPAAAPAASVCPSRASAFVARIVRSLARRVHACTTNDTTVVDTRGQPVGQDRRRYPTDSYTVTDTRRLRAIGGAEAASRFTAVGGRAARLLRSEPTLMFVQ